MPETHAAHATYSAFNLADPNDEERLRYVLSVFSLDELYQLAQAVATVKEYEYGRVGVIIRAGKIVSIERPVITEKVKNGTV